MSTVLGLLNVALLSVIAFVSGRGPAIAVRQYPVRPSVINRAPPSQQRVDVNGFAFDSLRNEPLAGAFISVRGMSRTALSDSMGRFRLDSLLPGQYTIDMQHDVIDSLGLSGVSIRTRVTDGRDTVTIAAPSFATLWAGACGITEPPVDSGFVYGTVRNARDDKPVADAAISIHWVNIASSGTKTFSEKRWRNEARSDVTGSYAICGVPVGTGLRITAFTDSLASGAVDLAPRVVRVQRRDLLLGTIYADSASMLRGVVRGVVRDENGKTVSGARVDIEGAPQARTDGQGQFIFPNVPAGTRQLQLTAIGSLPANEIVNVAANDTTRVDVSMHKVTEIAAVVIMASQVRERLVRDIDERKHSTSGYFRDSTQIPNVASLQSTMSTFPSTVVSTGRGGVYTISFPAGRGEYCTAVLWIDGRLADFDELRDLAPRDVGAIEMYPRWMDVPTQFVKSSTQCGAVVVWSKFKLP